MKEEKVVSFIDHLVELRKRLIVIAVAVGCLPAVVAVHCPRSDNIGKHLEVKAFPRIDNTGRLIGLIHIIRDITDRKHKEAEHQRLQSQFIQTQKLDSIGRLAGGIAHDLNNILSVILGYSDLSKRLNTGDEKLADYLGMISGAGEKAASLTRQILAFSRKQVLEMRPVNVNLSVENMEKRSAV